jgi:hypothetical protein
MKADRIIDFSARYNFKVDEMSELEETQSVLSMLMMILLERRRG